MKQLNEAQIQKKWAPMLEDAGIQDVTRKSWVAKYAHYHALNEAAMGGVSTPYATLYNVPGVGNAMPASSAATTGAQFTGSDVQGSGDKWPALLPMALQVAARTVGFDIVNVVPMPGPTGVVSYLDYVYAGGKQPFGAKPAHNPATANPDEAGAFDPATGAYEAPHAFKVNIGGIDASTLANGTVVTFSANDGSVSGDQLTAT